MPRVNTRTKSRAGKQISCGACGKTIEPGERYLYWSFRYGGKRIRCAAHPPRRGDLTQAIYSGLLNSMEDAEQAIDGAESIEDVKAIMEELAGEVEEVKDQYEEAAEPFQGGGPNGERFDEFESFHSEFDQFYPDEVEFDEDAARVKALREYVFGELPPHEQDEYPDEESLPIPNDPDDHRWNGLIERLGLDEQTMSETVDAKVQEAREEVDAALQAAKDEALGIIGNSPV